MVKLNRFESGDSLLKTQGRKSMTGNLSVSGADLRKNESEESTKYFKEFRNYVYDKFSNVENQLTKKVEREYIEKLIISINAKFEEISKV